MKGVVTPKAERPQDMSVDYVRLAGCAAIWPVYGPTHSALNRAHAAAERDTANRIAEAENLTMLRQASQEDPAMVAIIDSFVRQRQLEGKIPTDPKLDLTAPWGETKESVLVPRIRAAK